MFTSGVDGSPITPAESTRHAWDLEATREARNHDLAVRAQELAVIKRQTSWGSLLQLPLTILKLPLYILLGVGFIVAMVRKHDPTEDFWSLLR